MSKTPRTAKATVVRTAKAASMAAADKARILDMILDFSKLGSATVRFQKGDHGDCVIATALDGNGNFIGDAMGYVSGPYADNHAVFAASDGVRDIVAKRFPRHKKSA